MFVGQLKEFVYNLFIRLQERIRLYGFLFLQPQVALRQASIIQERVELEKKYNFMQSDSQKSFCCEQCLGILTTTLPGEVQTKKYMVSVGEIFRKERFSD